MWQSLTNVIINNYSPKWGKISTVQPTLRWTTVLVHTTLASRPKNFLFSNWSKTGSQFVSFWLSTQLITSKFTNQMTWKAPIQLCGIIILKETTCTTEQQSDDILEAKSKFKIQKKLKMVQYLPHFLVHFQPGLFSWCCQVLCSSCFQDLLFYCETNPALPDSTNPLKNNSFLLTWVLI